MKFKRIQQQGLCFEIAVTLSFSVLCQCLHRHTHILGLLSESFFPLALLPQVLSWCYLCIITVLEYPTLVKIIIRYAIDRISWKTVNVSGYMCSIRTRIFIFLLSLACIQHSLILKE